MPHNITNPAEVDVDVIDEIVYGYGFPSGTSADQICATLAKDGVYDPKDPQQAETVDGMVADYLSDVEDPYCVGCGKEIGEKEECESVEGGLICLDCDELQENPTLDVDEVDRLVDDRKYEFDVVDGPFVSGSSIPDFTEVFNAETSAWGTDREKFANALRVTRIEEGDTAADIAEFAITNGILPPYLLEDYKEYVETKNVRRTESRRRAAAKHLSGSSTARKKNVRRTESRRRAAEKRASRSSTAPVEKEEVHFSIARPQRAVAISSKWPETEGEWERPDNWRDLVIYEVTTNYANPQAVLDVIQTVIEDNEDLAVYVPTKGSRIIIRGLPENIDEIKEQVALRLQLLPGNTSRDNPLRIKETILFEVANGSAARIKRELQKTGLFKIGKTSKGASYTTIEVINLYGFANWAKAKAIREKYDLAFVKNNPHGGVRNNPPIGHDDFLAQAKKHYKPAAKVGSKVSLRFDDGLELEPGEYLKIEPAENMELREGEYSPVLGDYAVSIKEPLVLANKGPSYVAGGTIVGAYKISSDTGEEEPTDFYHSGGYKSVIFVPNKNIILENPHGGVRNNPIRDNMFFEVANESAAKIKRELKKTGLFKIGKTSKGSSYTTIEVINLYGAENWATAKAIREKYDLAFVKKNPHGGIHENPSERCETVGRAAQKTCETTVRASRAAMAGARGARDSWRRNPYPDTNSAGVISYNNAHPGGTPVASSSRSWDADAVRKKADAEKMYHASTWVEPGKEKDKSAYKFPHHYADGKNTLSPRGVAAAMAALMGARSERWGGPHFPDVNYESARRGIYKHLAEHYRKDLGREPPSLESVGGREPLGEKRRKRLNPDHDEFCSECGGVLATTKEHGHPVYPYYIDKSWCPDEACGLYKVTEIKKNKRGK